jgi:hypothetical protein
VPPKPILLFLEQGQAGSGFDQVYRSRLVRHRPQAYVVKAAGERCCWWTALSGANPYRSTGQVLLQLAPFRVISNRRFPLFSQSTPTCAVCAKAEFAAVLREDRLIWAELMRVSGAKVE